jgi:squalene-associated FAD-dependent desaturase
MKCAVIGGGLAGLSAAVYLTDNNHSVTIFESSATLGGRAKQINTTSELPHLDYGQHVLSSAYKYMFKFADKIGSRQKFKIPERLDVTFMNHTTSSKLKTGYLPYPFNLLLGLMNFSLISGEERRALIKFLFFIKNSDESFYTSKSLCEFFAKHNQTENLIKSFWNKVVISIFNTKTEDVDPQMFVFTMRKLFFEKKDNFIVFAPKLTLDELLISPAIDYLESKNAAVKLKEKVTSFNIESNRVKKIVTDKGEYSDFDFVISATQPYQLINILPESELTAKLSGFKYSPIITAFIKIDKPFLKDKMTALIDSEIDWIFNFDKYISVVISANEKIADFDKNSLKNVIISELNSFFPVFSSKNVLDFVLINEKKSTIMSDNLINRLRDNIYSPYTNLIFAGDWTNTGLPATIESAILSGKFAAWRVENSLKLWTYTN